MDLKSDLQHACCFGRRVFVGDVVVLKDPQNSDNYIVRRLAAIEGYEMVSKDEKDEPFVLEKDQCWVLADNENLKPKVDGTFLFNNLIIEFLFVYRTTPLLFIHGMHIGKLIF